MDILTWSRENQSTLLGRSVIWICYHLLAIVAWRAVHNWACCTALVQGMSSRQSSPTAIVMGGSRDSYLHVASLDDGAIQFIVGGNEAEQVVFQDWRGVLRYQFLAPSSNTSIEAEQAVRVAVSHGAMSVLVVCHEFHCTRAVLTIIKQCQKQNVVLRIIPHAHIGADRGGISPELRNLAIIVEALKLHKYQKRGDVATFDEALAYSP